VYQYLAVAPPVVASLSWSAWYLRVVVTPLFVSVVTLPARIVVSPSSWAGWSMV
jgi:hypothetical protein